MATSMTPGQLIGGKALGLMAVALTQIGILAATIAAGLIWYERRLLSLVQDRYGPNRVGPAGLLQLLADTFKILFKEDWVPPFSDRRVFVVAPSLVLITALLSFIVVPVAEGWVVADLNTGLLFFLAMSSLAVYSVVLAGWSSRSKYSLVGGLRGDEGTAPAPAAFPSLGPEGPLRSTTTGPWNLATGAFTDGRRRPS